MKKCFLPFLLLLVGGITAQGQGPGPVNQTAARIRRLTSEPLTCAAGDVYHNLTTHKDRQCLTVNTWSDIGTGGGTVTSVSGTTNQINSTGGATPVLSLSSTIIAPGTLRVTTSITDDGLTSGRIPIAGTGGLLGDDADLTFSGGDTLNATKLISSLVNGLTITNNGTNTLNIAAGKSFVVSNGLTLAGTDSTTMTFPSTSATIARIDAGNAFIGNQTIAVGQTTTSQTDLLINPATKASGNLIDAQVNGTSKFSVASDGTTTTPLAFKAGDGSTAATSYRFQTGGGIYGFYWASAVGPAVSYNNTASLAFPSEGLRFVAANYLSWSSTSALNGSLDTTISRNAAGVVQFGTTAANALGSWTATNGTLSGTLTTPIIKPASNSSTAVQITQADGSTGVVVVDTSAKRVGINGTPAATLDVEVSATGAGATLAALFYGNDSGTGRGLRVYGVGSGSSGDDGLGLSPNTSLPFYIWDSSGPGSANRNMTIANTGAVSVNKAAGSFSSPAYLTNTNCSDSAGAAACGAAAAGSFVIDAAATSVVVSTTAVTANSQIFVQEDSSLGTRLGVTCNTQSVLIIGPPTVTARTAGTSFTVSIVVGPTTNPACYNYHIVN